MIDVTYSVLNLTERRIGMLLWMRVAQASNELASNQEAMHVIWDVADKLSSYLSNRQKKQELANARRLAREHGWEIETEYSPHDKNRQGFWLLNCGTCKIPLELIT